jgi:hypothetical protein
MIEDGIVQLVQADPTVAAQCSFGGFYLSLPKGTPLPSWSYLVVSEVTGYTLRGRTNLTPRRLQIDVYAMDGAEALNLARAIDNVLSGWKGALPDTQATAVQGIFRDMTVGEADFFDEVSRTYRRMLEFFVHYENLG